MAVTTVNDTVHGLEGELVINIDGNLETLAVGSFEATFSIDKETQKVVGRRTAMSKATGSSITGTMTILYQHIPRFVELANMYKRTGKMPRFKIVGKNSDKASTMPDHTIVLYDCIPDEIPLIKLGDEPFMKLEIGFTAEDYEQLS